MSVGNIKGIVVEIGGETGPLDKALKGVNSTSRDLQQELTAVNKLLRLDPTNVDLLKQRQGLLAESITTTKGKLDALKLAQEQFVASGKDLNDENYRALQREVITTEQKLKGLETQAKNSSGALEKLGKAAKDAEGGSKALMAGVGAAGAALVVIGAASIVAAGQLEATTVAFTTMLGSAEKATTLLKELQNFAATTPFEFTEIQGAAKSLLAFGVGAEDVTETLRRLGDVSSGVGAPINEIAQLYGKAKTSGRLFSEDINQLTGRGIPIIKELAAQFSTSESEVKKLVEEGKVGFPQLELAFKNMTAEGSQFGGMMDAQSKTLPGMWSNVMDALGQSSVVVGQELIKTFDLKDKLADVINGLSSITALLQSAGLMGALEKIFPDNVRIVVVAIAGAIIAGLIPAFVGLAVATWAVLAPLLPFMAAGAAIAALAYLIFKNWEPISAFFVNTWTVVSTFLTTTWTAISQKATEIFNAIAAFFVSTWNTVSTFLTTMWTGIATTATNVWNGIGTFFTNLWNGITTTVTNVWNGIINFFTTTWTSISTGITTAWNAIPVFFAGLWDSIKNIFMGVVNGIVDFVTTTFSKQIADINVIFESLKIIFQNVWDIINNIFLGAVLLILDIVTGNFTKLKEDAGNIFTNLKDLFVNIWENIKNIFRYALEIITTTLAQTWNGIKTTAETVWNGIKTFFENLWTGIKTTATTAWDNFKIWITESFNQIIQGAKDVWNGLKDFFTGLWTDIKTAATNAWNGLKSAVSTIMTTMVNGEIAIFNGILDFFRGLPTTLYDLGVSIFTSLKNGISSILNTLGTVISTGFNSAIKFITDLPGKALQWGKDFIGGFTDGIMNAMDGLKAKVQEIANTIRSFLHFSTPDEGPLADYESWMPDFMSGLANGIEKSKHLVTNAIRGLGADMSVGVNLSSISAVGMSASTGSSHTQTGNTYVPSITIINQGTIIGRNGMDEFAKIIGQKLGGNYALSVGGDF